MLWIGVLPALLVFWIMSGVRESPVWLARQQHLRDRQEKDRMSLGRLFTPALLPITIQTSVLMGAFIFSYHSITFWYPTFLGAAKAGAAPVPRRAESGRHAGQHLLRVAVGDRARAARRRHG